VEVKTNLTSLHSGWSELEIHAWFSIAIREFPCNDEKYNLAATTTNTIFLQHLLLFQMAQYIPPHSRARPPKKPQTSLL